MQFSEQVQNSYNNIGHVFLERKEKEALWSVCYFIVNFPLQF